MLADTIISAASTVQDPHPLHISGSEPELWPHVAPCWKRSDHRWHSLARCSVATQKVSFNSLAGAQRLFCLHLPSHP